MGRVWHFCWLWENFLLENIDINIEHTKKIIFSCLLLTPFLKMYGNGAEIDEIRESATIVVSIDISRPNVIIAFKFLEHV